jgi:pyrrolidone-carboxylate peptidase
MARVNTLSDLQSYFEAALLEARSLVEGGHAGTLSEQEARTFGQAAGEALWRLANASARQRTRTAASARTRRQARERREQRRRRPRTVPIRDAELMAEDLGGEGHYRPMQHMLGMIDSVASQSYQARRLRTPFRAMRDAFIRAARGRTSIDFQRSGASAGMYTSDVLVTGFDPFRFNQQGRQVQPIAGDWNPSGAAVLQLDGQTIDVDANLRAAVEGVIFPVRYDIFRQGIVESVIRPLLPTVDGVITVSMSPGIDPTSSPVIERYAVGAHELNNDRLESIPPVTVQGQSRTDPGPPIIEAQGDIPGIAQEAGLPSAQQQGRTNIQLDFTATHAENAIHEANRFRRALGIQPQQNPVVDFDYLAHGRRISHLEREGQGRPGITFRVGPQSFQARLLRGPGGNFLSNEVSYRVLRAITEGRNPQDITSFHVHTPRGTAQQGAPIPQAAVSQSQRAERAQALHIARGVLSRLVRTLTDMIKAIARRAQRRNSSSGTP